MPSLAMTQMVTLAGILLALLVLAYLLLRGWIDWRLALAPGLWLVHGAVFLIAWLTASPDSPTELFTAWSQVWRLQAILTLIGAFVYYAWERYHGF